MVAIPITTQNNHSLQAIFGVPTSDSGERVSIETCLALPQFINGVRLVASTMARADLFVYSTLPKGGQEKDPSHHLWQLCTGKVNPFANYFSWRQALVSNAIWAGNGYSLIVRDDLGQPESLYNLDSREVYPIVEYTGGRISGLWYGINTPQGQGVIPADDMIHVKNLCMHTGTEGISLVDNLRLVLGKQIAQQKFSSTFFKHGSHIDKYYAAPFWLTAEQKDELKTTLADYKSTANAHKIMVCQGGAELKSLPISAVDTQLVEGLEMSIVEMANIIGITPSKLGGKGFTSYGSLEQDNLAVLGDTYDAWFSCIEAELNSKLLSPEEARTTFIEFDRDSLQATDPAYKKSLMEQYEREALSWEEMRDKLNRTTDRGKMHWVRNGAFQDPALIDVPPPPVPAQAPPVPTSAQLVPAQVPDEAPQVQRAITLTEANLTRLKTRIAKAIESDPDLTKHFEIIRSNLAGLDSSIIETHLNTLQAEITAVLPEQRGAVLDRLDLNQLAKELWTL